MCALRGRSSYTHTHTHTHAHTRTTFTSLNTIINSHFSHLAPNQEKEKKRLSAKRETLFPHKLHRHNKTFTTLAEEEHNEKKKKEKPYVQNADTQKPLAWTAAWRRGEETATASNV